MLTAHESSDIGALRRKARSIELQAGRASPGLAAQLRRLAERYYAEADAEGARLELEALWRTPSPYFVTH
jgi:hypothetical protein